MTSYRLSRLMVISILWLLMVPVGLFAQKVDKTLEQANRSFAQNQLVDAQKLYLEVLATNPNNYQATYRMGQISRRFQDYREAIRYFERAVSINPTKNDTVFLLIGLTYKVLDNCRKAEDAFMEFMRQHPSRDNLHKRAQLEIDGCQLVESALTQRPKYRVKPTTFNSTADDLLPTRLDQQQEDVFLTFVSSRTPPGKKSKPNQVTGQPNDRDIYYVVRENDTTFSAGLESFPKRINHKKQNDGPATFTGDGLTMYFVRCNSRQNKNGCSIFESRYDPVKKEWGKPQLVEELSGTKEIVTSRGKTKTTPTDDRQPFVTKDGRTLFFSSDRPGGEGGFDLWYSRRVGTSWSAPANLGSAVNSSFDEFNPFYNDEGNKLYFASNGYPSFGGFDLFEVPGTIDSWGDVENVGFPVNTTYNDAAGIWVGDDSLAYFTSNRPGGVGGYDVYWAIKKPVKLSSLKIAVKGTIRDKLTLEPVEFATAILFQYRPDGSLMALDTFQTDQSARYEFPLKADRNYKILGNAPDYLANEEEVTTMGIRSDQDIVQNIDIDLEPIQIGAEITLNNVYYDFDEYYLRTDAVDELKGLRKILVDNPNIVIQLGSHTDSNGDIPYNKGLSDNRARAVIRYLVENGIDPARLTWFGYGETDPLIFPETNPEDEQANRRTEFRITSIDFE